MNEHVIFDFSQCKFLDPRAIVSLGGMVRTVKARGCAETLDVSRMHAPVRIAVEQNGFAALMGAKVAGRHGNSIPYREYDTENKNAILSYLERDWLGRGWINIDADLAHAIVGQMWEIYANAFEHGKSPFGVFSCGQHFPIQRKLVIAVSDFGLGIPSNARTKVGEEASGETAMRWAFQKGNSTAFKGIARGMGLGLLVDFVRTNKGSLEVISADGYAKIDGYRETYQTLRNDVRGTIVQVSFECDGRRYAFNPEANVDLPLF